MNTKMYETLIAIFFGGFIGYALVFLLLNWEKYKAVAFLGFTNVTYPNIVFLAMILVSIVGLTRKNHGFFYIVISIFLALIAIGLIFTTQQQYFNFEEAVFFRAYIDSAIIFAIASTLTSVIGYVKRK